ncbi:hypothetical protein CDO73_09535 [Saccharibacillus sp. O23]|uniref:hypothetical protein n=1 Tax=Saccharibacillus sp. O23 TaxID=2009338 RepID=UPI000B4E4144|nr:hypothetical protein [Saccharibacillus sp. O23]OWR30821.1 hypothetical protein CDO73_09535 [Saccharibacillus sp. O23]
MNLFRLSPFVRGRDRMEDFLKDCFVSIGYPGIGDLEAADAAEVSKRLRAVYGYEGSELQRRLEEVDTFVSGMADGNYVLVSRGTAVWLGDLGDYYYRDEYDTLEEATCHRRGVTWLGVLPAEALSSPLRGFLTGPEAVGERLAVASFPLPAESAGLEAFAAQAPGGLLPGLPASAISGADGFSEAAAGPAEGASRVDAETLREAVAVLREALRGDDPELRVRAAEALLRYAK